MKKIIVIPILILFFVFFSSINCHASNILNSDELYENLPYESQIMLEDMGIYEVSDSLNADYTNIFSQIGVIIKSKYLSPLKICLLCIGIIVLSSFLCSFYDEIANLCMLAGAVTVCLICLPNVAQLIIATQKVTSSVSVFVLSSIPIYAVLQVAGGNPSMSGSFSAVSIFSANIFTALLSKVIIPSLSIFLGLSVSSAFSHINIKSLCDNVYKCMKWVLISSITIFCTIISMQSALSAATDQVGTKTIKILAGSTVPIVGSAFGDGIVAVQNSVKLLKSGASAFGIIACFCIFLPPIIELVLWLFSFQTLVIVSDFFSYSKIKEILDLMCIVIKILLAVVISFLIVSIIISAITLFFGT